MNFRVHVIAFSNCRSQLPLRTAVPPTLPPPHEHASPAMKSKHSAAELKHLALEGAIAACEARAFAAFHGSTLDGHNHTAGELYHLEIEG